VNPPAEFSELIEREIKKHRETAMRAGITAEP